MLYPDPQDRHGMNDVASQEVQSLDNTRTHWVELFNLATGFTFETDSWGRFAAIGPDPVLGWPAASLIGQPAHVLLTGPRGIADFNPFRVATMTRHRQVWLKRGDGGLARLLISATPILDGAGAIAGIRGVGMDITSLDHPAGRSVSAPGRTGPGRIGPGRAGPGRAEVLDEILLRMGQEVLASRMMGAALEALVSALASEGAAVLVIPEGATSPVAAYGAGAGADRILDVSSRYLAQSLHHPRTGLTMTADGSKVLIAPCQTRSGETAGLAIWRPGGTPDWEHEDHQLLTSAANIIRMVLEHETIQREMARQARTDPLTGLLNRRAFLEEVERHMVRLDRENLAGTLIFADLDFFKPVNDRFGHETGDKVLMHTATLLRRTFRPGDLVARLGGDEFAVWMNGADHMTAAERAEFLRDATPREMADVIGPEGPDISMSIGIASRKPGDEEKLDSLMRRADMAMYEVKRGGRAHWRVSLKQPV